MHCEGLSGLWRSCPAVVSVDTSAGVQTVVDTAAVLFLVFVLLIALVFGAWVSSMTD